MVYGDYTERRILIYSRTISRQPRKSRSNFGRSHLTPALIYNAAPRALKLYRTVYSLKMRRRSFHLHATVLLNDATVYTAFINPRRACAARVTVVVLCVCLFVCLFVSIYSRTTGYEAAYERYQQLQCYKGRKIRWRFC